MTKVFGRLYFSTRIQRFKNRLSKKPSAKIDFRKIHLHKSDFEESYYIRTSFSF